MIRPALFAIPLLLAAAACGSDSVVAPEVEPEAPTMSAGSSATLGTGKNEIITIIVSDPEGSYGPSGQESTGYPPEFTLDIPTTWTVGQPFQRSFTVTASQFGAPAGQVSFGDGSATQNVTVTGANGTYSASISHTWAAPGTYKVVVFFSDDMGTMAKWRTVQVVPLGATLMLEPGVGIHGVSPASVYVNSTPYPWSGTAHWGDGTSSPIQSAYLGGLNATHAYAAPGTYDVTVAVGASTATTSVMSLDQAEVWSVQGPATAAPGQPMSLTVSVPQGGEEGNGIHYDGVVIEWGDGSPSTLDTDWPSWGDPQEVAYAHTYQTPGPWTVTVKLMTSHGSLWRTLQIQSQIAATILQLTPFQGLAGLPASLSVTAAPEPWTGTIAWGDGATSDVPPEGTRTFQHTYASAGQYSVAVTATGAGALAAAATTQATIAEPMTVQFPSPVVQGLRSHDLRATLASQGTYQRLVADWGDGSPTSTVMSPSGQVLVSHNYRARGTWTLTASLETAAGTVIRTLPVTVLNIAPILTTAVSPSLLAVGGAVSLTGSFQDPGADTWNATVDWADGSPPTQFEGQPGASFSLSHTFLAPGTYQVQVSVTDGQDTSTKAHAVEVVNTPPVAVLSTPATVACTEAGAIPVSGAGSSDPDGTIASWAWSVGGAQVATGAEATLSLPLGSHAVTLTVTDDFGATGTAQGSIHVVDGGAPSISVNQTVTQIFPADSQMVAVATFRAEDDCDPAAGLEISVTANEPLGAGDVRLTTLGDGSIQVAVLAARKGSSKDGRIYTIRATATDASGNEAQAQAKVTVLHDNRNNNSGKGKGR